VDEELVVRSPRNARVQAVIALHDARNRRREGLHLAEGRRVCSEALARAEVLELLFLDEHADLADAGASSVRRTRVDERVMERLSDAVTPQGVVAVVRTPDMTVSPPAAGSLLVLDRVADPGNVGTLIRTAAAFGVPVVVAGGADPFGPKAVRASAGTCYATTVIRRPDLTAALAEVRTPARPILGLAADGPRSLTEIASELDGSDFCLIVGSEPAGIASLDRQGLDAMVRIPMRGGVESLNVAAAGAVALYALLDGTIGGSRLTAEHPAED